MCSDVTDVVVLMNKLHCEQGLSKGVDDAKIFILDRLYKHLEKPNSHKLRRQSLILGRVAQNQKTASFMVKTPELLTHTSM